MSFSAPSKTLKAAPKLLLTVGLALAVTACGNGRSIRGYVFDKELSDAIQPGVDNQISVQATLGTPTIASQFDNKTWYYVSTQVRVRPIYWPDPKEHRVMAISFADNGVVSEINNYDLDDMRKVNPVADKTPTRGRNLNFFQQLFSGIGSFGGAPTQGPSQGRGGNVPNGG